MKNRQPLLPDLDLSLVLSAENCQMWNHWGECLSHALCYAMIKCYGWHRDYWIEWSNFCLVCDRELECPHPFVLKHLLSISVVLNPNFKKMLMKLDSLRTRNCAKTTLSSFFCSLSFLATFCKRASQMNHNVFYTFPHIARFKKQICFNNL